MALEGSFYPIFNFRYIYTIVYRGGGDENLGIRLKKGHKRGIFFLGKRLRRRNV
jgi:hypothetical protein